MNSHNYQYAMILTSWELSFLKALADLQISSKLLTEGVASNGRLSNGFRRTIENCTRDKDK